MLLRWLRCTGTRAGRGGSDAHRDGDDHTDAYHYLDPNTVDLHEHPLEYADHYAHADQYGNEYGYVNIYTQSDAFRDADAVIDSIDNSFLDTEPYQYADGYTYKHPNADRNSHSYDHTVSVDAGHSLISEVTDLCRWTFGW